MTPLSGTAWWTVTDAATAAATWGGVDDFALQTPDSLSAPPGQATFVSPSGPQAEAAMQAAVANMTTQPDGTLLPDPRAERSAGSSPTRSPMSNTPSRRPAPDERQLHSQHHWPSRAQRMAELPVGAGQNDQPGGMVQLPGSLVKAAQAQSEGRERCGSVQPGHRFGGERDGWWVGAFGLQREHAEFVRVVSLLERNGFGHRLDVIGVDRWNWKRSWVFVWAYRYIPLGRADFTAFETVSPTSWALPLLGVLVLALLLPGLILLASGRSLTEALGGLRSAPVRPKRSLLTRSRGEGRSHDGDAGPIRGQGEHRRRCRAH